MLEIIWIVVIGLVAGALVHRRGHPRAGRVPQREEASGLGVRRAGSEGGRDHGFTG